MGKLGLFILFFLTFLEAQESKELKGKPKAYLVETLSLDTALSYQYLLQRNLSDSSQQEIIILHRGTEVNRLIVRDHFEGLNDLLIEHQLHQVQEERYSPTPYSTMELFYWPAVSFVDALKEKARWRDGFSSNSRFETNTLNRSSYTNFYQHFTWVQQFSDFHLGMMYGSTSSGGYSKLNVDPSYGQKLGENSTWALMAGVPGARLRFESYMPARPRFAFMEMDTSTRQPGVRSEVIKEEFYDEIFLAPPMSITTSLELKYSHFYYILFSNSDLYRHFIHEVGIRELPSPIGQWGILCNWTHNSFILGAQYQIGIVQFEDVGFGSYRSLLEWVPIDLTIRMRDTNHMNIAFQTSFYISNPFRSTPWFHHILDHDFYFSCRPP